MLNPTFFVRITRLILIAALPGCLSTGCTKEARKNRAFNAAEHDFKAGAFDKAKIEYLNVLRFGSQNPTVFSRIGQIWFEQGSPLKAGAFMAKARELATNDLENRLRLARVYNAVGSRGEAQKEALFVLQHAPADGAALLLLAQLAQTATEISSAEQALAAFPEKESVPYFLAAGTVAMRKANLDGAQQLIDQALAADPKSAEAHHARALLFLLQKDMARARGEFKAAAELSPPRSNLKITYADYLARTGAAAEATTYLQSLTKTTPDFLTAWTLLARTTLSAKKPAEAISLLENVFSRDPDNVDARLIQADALLQNHQAKKATDVLELLDRSHPNAPVIKLQLAKAYLQDNRPEQATASLKQALTINPNLIEAILLSAKIDLSAGRSAQAINSLEGLLKKGNLGSAQILLADAYRAAGRLDDAASIFREQISQAPKKAEGYTFLGLIQEQQGKRDDARRSFEKARELDPKDLLALSKLIDFDLEAKDFESASRRAESQMQKEPKSGASYLLNGKVLTAKKQWPEAEASLKKAIDLDPSLSSAYDLLVGIYLETGKSEQAVRELESVLAKSPEDKAALITLASVEEKQQNFAKAAEAYQRLLSFDPNDVTALNNLAYIYAERLNQPDKGLELARKARTQGSANPAVADTLGWILFKRGAYREAVPLLEEASGKISDNPEVKFHSGMGHYMMGQSDAARSDFQQALNMKQPFPSKTEAEQRLQLLNQTAAGTDGLTAEQLEGLLKQHPNDVVVRLRLAEVYESRQSFVRAAAVYENTLKSNPKLGRAALRLAQLYAGPLKDPQKALEFAKKARELTPSDPRAAGILGRIAFDAGNFQWAYSLLQESSRQTEVDPVVMHDFAWVAYSLGKVDQARQLMEQLGSSSPSSEIAADAKLFLAMTSDISTPAVTEDEVKQTLKANPTYVPALMAAAALDTVEGQKGDAIKRYQEALSRFPAFAPAQKGLALLYADDAARKDEAYDLAVQARKTMPDDPIVAQLLGRLNYERKDYSHAVQLLQESARKTTLNVEGLCFLGLSLKAANQPDQAMKVLAEALAAGPREPLQGDVQRALTELRKKK